MMMMGVSFSPQCSNAAHTYMYGHTTTVTSPTLNFYCIIPFMIHTAQHGHTTHIDNQPECCKFQYLTLVLKSQMLFPVHLSLCPPAPDSDPHPHDVCECYSARFVHLAQQEVARR